MGQKAKKLKADLIRYIQEYPADLIPQTLSGGDLKVTRPVRREKSFSKTELINIIDKVYKDL